MPFHQGEKYALKQVYLCIWGIFRLAIDFLSALICLFGIPDKTKVDESESNVPTPSIAPIRKALSADGADRWSAGRYAGSTEELGSTLSLRCKLLALYEAHEVRADLVTGAGKVGGLRGGNISEGDTRSGERIEKNKIAG
eukprot:767141-Hanusia_phi.AAC.15